MRKFISSFRILMALIFMLFATNVPTVSVLATNDKDNGPDTTCAVSTGIFQQGNNCKITICHATSAIANPYSETSVALDAADGGNDNGDHYSEHDDPIFNSSMEQGDTWGDIIPPVPGSHSGLNWTTEGQAIWANGCEIPSTTVTPAAVTFNDVCGTVNDTYTVPTKTGVTYSQTAGTHAGSGAVTVTATANNGFTLSGTSSWMHIFTNVACPQPDVHVTPAAVTFNDVCGTGNDEYTVPTTTGVTYSASAGNHSGSGSVTVTATAQSGYVLDGTTSWSHTFTNVACETDLCPNLAGNQTVLPIGFVQQNDNTCKVLICHKTAAVNHPYNYISVAIDSVDGGNDNGDHYSEHDDPIFNSSMEQGDTWGDIIPPVPGSHSGLNWTTEGQAIWANECSVPESEGCNESAPEVILRLFTADSVQGDEEECPVDVCPNIEGDQTTIPDNMVKDTFGNCVTPGRGGDTPSQPNQPTTTTPVQLVNTGTDAMLNLFAGLVILGITAGLTQASRRRIYE